MLKYFVLSTILFSGLAFAQKSEIEKNKVNGKPTSIEESMQKASIRMQQITGYELQYHTKSIYNKDGNPISREYFNEDGNRVSSENFTYNEDNKISSSEMKSEDETLKFYFQYEYTEDGYTIVKSENDVNILQTEYKLDNNQNVIYEKETNLFEEGNLFTEKKYEYTGGFLTKTIVKYNNGFHTLLYKNDALGNAVEEQYMDKNNKLIYKFVRKFDKNQNITEEITYDTNGKITNSSQIMYEYDEQKNWIKRTQYTSKIDEPISNTLRTIRY